MTKWEYVRAVQYSVSVDVYKSSYSTFTKPSESTIDEVLDSLGRMGFELVSVVPTGKTDVLTHYLKRPKR